jgi:hypothetical protein
VQSLLRDMNPVNFDIELWDGTRWIGDTQQFRRFTWKINNPDIIWDVLRSSNQIDLGEAFTSEDFTILADLEAAFSLADYLITKEWSAAEVLRLGAMGVLTERSKQNSGMGSSDCNFCSAASATDHNAYGTAIIDDHRKPSPFSHAARVSQPSMVLASTRPAC